MTEAYMILCWVSILLIPFAAIGIELMSAGLGRSKNTSHSMLGAVMAIAVAAIAYCATGWAIQSYDGGRFCAVALNGKTWNWMGAGPLFLRGIRFDDPNSSLAAVFGMWGACVTASIALGGGAERSRLGAICLSTALLAGFTYPLFAHWAWSGGWLAQLGPNYGLGRGYLDGGGAGAIHAAGGLAALATAWTLGPRRGKFTREGMPTAIPGHNAALVLLGCLFAWIGWIGLDCAGSLLFRHVPGNEVALIAINATLSAAAGALTAAFITGKRFGKVDASLSANGWVAGLVSSAAGCAAMRPAAAILVGLIGGALAIYAIEWLELYLSIDDPGGIIAVHALCGIWSLLAVGLVALDAGPGQWLAQLAGVAALIGIVLPLSLGWNWLLNRIYPQRVSAEAERQGLDLHEIGASAYPDFMTHGEDSWLR